VDVALVVANTANLESRTVRDFDADALCQMLSEHLTIEFSDEYEGDRRFITATISFDGTFLTSDSISVE